MHRDGGNEELRKLGKKKARQQKIDLRSKLCALLGLVSHELAALEIEPDDPT